MYLLIQFTGNYGKWENFTDEEWREIREAFPGMPEGRPKWCPGTDFILTTENAKIAGKHGLEFKVSETPAGHGAGQMIVKLTERIRALELHRENVGELVSHGAAVQIHVPDFVLMGINDVMHIDDACTDELQTYLNENWRILAVCPPNGSRRPDYILGRRNYK